MFERDLNPEQLRVVTCEENPVMVLAGAGSGKTRVIVYRIAYLILKKNVDPSSILAVTFTNKAAGEMKNRTERLTGIPAPSMNISTFHSYAAKMLRRFGDRLGYRSDFAIFDEGDQASLIKLCMDELGISTHLMKPGAAVSAISRLKDDRITPEEFSKMADNPWSKKLLDIYSLYQRELKRQNAMDFGDLLINLVRLLEEDFQVQDWFKKRIEYLLVDEYQDTNRVQYMFVKHLARLGSNVMVVGDEDQLIYRWRGAEIRNTLCFQDEFPGAAIIKLERNYRSTHYIVGAAQSVIRNNRERLGKNIWTETQGKEKVKVVATLDDIGEVRYVAEEIEQLKKDGFRYGDVAIFYRTNAQSRVFEVYFKKYGIPYVIYGGVKFFERMEIKDFVAYLRLLLNSHDDVSFVRVINRPSRGIGAATLNLIREVAKEKGLSLFESLKQLILTSGLKGKKVEEGAATFVGLIEKYKGELAHSSLGDVAKRLLDESGYLSCYDKTFDADAERIDNINEVINSMFEFEGTASQTLPLFLDQVSLVSEADLVKSDSGAVTMLTAHLSKGLEFPVVFMVGMEEGVFPHARALSDVFELEEERRLCYVGMTRAMERLYMIYARSRKTFGNRRYNDRSRFIDEIDEKYIEVVPLACTEEFSEYGSGDEIYGRYFEQAPQRDECFEFDSEGRFFRGMRIKHPVFGVGVVEKVEGKDGDERLTIRFGGILKKIAAKYVSLAVLSD